MLLYILKKNYNLNLLEVAGVQGLVEVEEDLLVDHLLELEILEGRPELYAQDVIEDLDCWGVNHNQWFQHQSFQRNSFHRYVSLKLLVAKTLENFSIACEQECVVIVVHFLQGVMAYNKRLTFSSWIAFILECIAWVIHFFGILEFLFPKLPLRQGVCLI